jgi:hypothetical protein
VKWAYLQLGNVDSVLLAPGSQGSAAATTIVGRINTLIALIRTQYPGIAVICGTPFPSDQYAPFAANSGAAWSTLLALRSQALAGGLNCDYLVSSYYGPMGDSIDPNALATSMDSGDRGHPSTLGRATNAAPVAALLASKGLL